MVELDVLREQGGHADRRPRLRRRDQPPADGPGRGPRPLPRAAAGRGRDRLRPEARRAARPSWPARSRAAACSSGRWSRRMEIESLRKLRKLEPDLRLGWTYPKTRRDWTQYGWAAPGAARPGSRRSAAASRASCKKRARARRRRRLGLSPDHHAEGWSRPPRKRRRRADRLDRRRRGADAGAARDGGGRDLLERPAPVRGGAPQAPAGGGRSRPSGCRASPGRPIRGEPSARPGRHAGVCHVPRRSK